MSLPRLDRIDRFGHCCVCTRNLLTKCVVDGKSIDMFVPEYGDVIFLLNDGSKMQVTICKICQNSYDLNDPSVQKDVMDACMKGWELETKKLISDGGETPEGNFIRWSEEYGKNYLNHMSKKHIDCNINSMDKNLLVEKSKKLSKEFQEQIIRDREKVKK